ERVTRSGNRPTADDRRAERRARRAEREIGNLGKKAKTAAETAADLRNQAAATTDRGAKRRLDAAAKRAERDVKRYTGKVEDIQEDLAESWKRR
ncbi:MAG: hypothetical protein IPK85_02555, partial [Gemmatimonadetes bacterium]|nr:hypothetical protein [Gemmatimonadota bacterium]